jgi:TRAP-type C4-dicarboxylate transport system permease small subunit
MTDEPRSDSSDEREPQAGTLVPVALEETLAAVVMGALVLITLANVLVRYFSDESFAWTEEISVFLLVVLTLAGSAAAAARDRHVRIEVFSHSGSAQRRRFLALVASACSTGLFAALTVLTGRMAFDEYRFGETSMAIGIPRWWYTVWVPILCAWVTVRFAAWGLRRRMRP